MTNFRATMLARAGLERLGFTFQSDGSLDPPDSLAESAAPAGALFAETLDPHSFLPAAGQGAVAIEIRSEDDETDGLLAAINDPNTFARVSAERAFLALLGAGCQTPVGAHTWVDSGGTLHLKVRVFDEDDLTKEPAKAEAAGSAKDAERDRQRSFWLPLLMGGYA